MTVPAAFPPLDPSLVQRPDTCRLTMRIAPQGLDVVIASRVNDNPLLWRHLAFPPQDVEHADDINVTAFEETVYDNRLLLADFYAVDVIIDTCRFMAMPADVATADTAEKILADIYPDKDNTEVVISTATPDAAIVALVPGALTAFVRRTFGVKTNITHRMAPLCQFFNIKNKLGNNGKLHVHIADNRTDIIAIGREGLLMANSFRTETETDVLFYVMAAARNLDFDNSTDRIILSGNAQIRDKVLPLLRKYVSYVMPMIFPSQIFKLGHDALVAPFELIALPLLN